MSTSLRSVRRGPVGMLVATVATHGQCQLMGDGETDVDDTIHEPFPTGPTPTEVSFTGRMLTFGVESSSGGNTGAIEIEVFSG